MHGSTEKKNIFMYTASSCLFQTHNKTGMTVSQSSNGYSLPETYLTRCYIKSATDQTQSLITTSKRRLF